MSSRLPPAPLQPHHTRRAGAKKAGATKPKAAVPAKPSGIQKKPASRKQAQPAWCGERGAAQPCAADGRKRAALAGAGRAAQAAAGGRGGSGIQPVKRQRRA